MAMFVNRKGIEVGKLVSALNINIKKTITSKATADCKK